MTAEHASHSRLTVCHCQDGRGRTLAYALVLVYRVLAPALIVVVLSPTSLAQRFASTFPPPPTSAVASADTDPRTGEPQDSTYSQSTVDYSLRIVWGGKQPQSFRGSISIDRGSLSLVQNLNLQPDAAGCVRSEGADKLEIRPTSPTTFGGVDIHVQGSHTSRLTFRFVDPLASKAAVSEHILPLHQLSEADWIQPLDARGTHLAVARTVADKLRVTADREHRLFSPQEGWQVVARGVKTGLPAGEYELRARYVPNRTATESMAQAAAERMVEKSSTATTLSRFTSTTAAVTVSDLDVVRTVTIDSSGNFPEVVWEWPTPAWEGSYLAEFSLYRKRLMSILPNSSAALTRRLELLVLDDRPNIDRRNVVRDWQPLFSVDLVEASQPGSLDWLAPWRGWGDPLNVRGMWEQVTFSTPTTRPPISHGSLGRRSVRFDAGESESDAAGSASQVDGLTIAPNSWLALPVTGLKAGKPHRLRVHIPTDAPMELATSVRSPEASGELPPLSRDAAIVIHERECTLEATQAVHDLLFWPNEQTSYVMLVNPSDRLTATVSHLEVDQAVVERGLAGRELAPEHPTRLEQAIEPEPLRLERMVGLYVDKPILIDSYAADRTLDEDSGRELDSWDAWLEAMRRLEFVMDWTDSNTLMIKVAADGAAIYPSQHLRPTLRYDSGAFFSDGRNPPVKDVVELLLRRLDREGKSMILAVDIDSNLPGLVESVERQANAPPKSQQPAMLQLDLQGEPRPGTGVRSHVDRYNPLHPAVQNQLVLVVRELAERYSHHPSFRGIAIQLDRDSQFVFAGDRWGIDPHMLRQFVTEMGLNLPSDEQLERAFRGPLRLTFLSWRAAKMTTFYRRLTEELTRRSPTSCLILNALRLWDEPPGDGDFWNVATTLRSPDEYMVAIGVDAAGVQAIDGLVLMQGHIARNPQSLVSSDWILDLASERALRQQLKATERRTTDSRPSTAGLVLLQPVGCQLAGIEQLGQASLSPSGSWLFPFAAQHGKHARKLWIDQLYDDDVQLMVTGGWLPAGGHEVSLIEFHRAFRRLPPVAMRDALPDNLKGKNIRLRRATFDNKTYLQIVNNAPWGERLEFELQVASPGKFQLRNLATDQLLPASQVAANRRAALWQVELEPYTLLAVEIDEPDASVAAVRHQPLVPIVAALEVELNALERAVSLAGDPNSQTRLEDIGGDFESWSNDSKPRGWNISSLPDVEFSRSSELPRSGRYSLSIVNRSRGEAAAWLQSEPIPVPRTGRLTLQAWLRQPSASAAATVRLSVVGRTSSGQRFERSQLYGERAEGRRIANDWGQRPATLYVADIPENISELQIAIDLIGPGKVWVDDVEVYEALLHPDERIYLRGQLLVAREALEKGNPFVAQRLLDSHWGKYINQFAERPPIDRSIPANETPPQAAAKVARAVNQPAASSEVERNERNDWNQSKPFFQQWRDMFRERWRR